MVASESNFASGPVVAIPKFPLESNLARSEPPVEKFKVSAAELHRPVFVSEAKAKLGVPASPCGSRANPEEFTPNCELAPTDKR